MFVKRAVLLCALSGFAATAAASDAMVLAPGKSVGVVDAEDGSIQVVVTAPADQPLDLAALLSSAGPKESVYSIATRMQLNGAGALVEGADGSIVLGAAPAALLPAANITGGLIVFQRGRYTHYDVAAASAVQTAVRPSEQLIRPKDEVPLPGRLTGSTPVQQAVAASGLALPSAVTLPATGTVSAGGGTLSVISTGGGVINWGSFNISPGNVVNFQQPSASSVTLNVTSGGQIQVPTGITTTGGVAPGGSITIR